MSAVALKRSGTTRRSGAGVVRARQADPGFVEFCDPTLRDRPPSGADWLHEIKWDGYRAQLHLRTPKVTIYSRSGLDWTDQFAPIADEAKSLRAQDAIVDGEVVVLGNTGKPDFQALRRELGKRHSEKLTYYAFDLLWLNGRDLRKMPLIERKRLLQTLLSDASARLIYVEFFEGDGATIYQHACRMGLKGIVSKRADSIYRPGRQESWIKTKCTKSDNFPIVAFVEKLGAHPRRIASLYLGRREGDRLLYAGKARTGYTLEAAKEVRELLDPLISSKSPLSVPVKKPKATWVRPVVEAEIEYGGITDDGLLREAVFKGVRDDLTLPRVKGPAVVPRHPVAPEKARGGVPRENILQLLPDAVTPTKEELKAYWRTVSKRALAYLGRRPLKLVRHTRGTTFYHKGPLPPIPPTVHEMKIEKREGGEGVRVWVDSLDGLLGLVDMDAVELHPWAATVDDIEHPDRLVFDLDPGDGVPWECVTETALKLREMLQEEGLDSLPKVTGGKGLHLMAPISTGITHDAARVYCRKMAQRLENTSPARYTTSPSPVKRHGRIYIDYLRNGRGTTAVGAYSPRARPGFPIAAPVTWTQVERGILPDAFSIDHPFKNSERASRRSRTLPHNSTGAITPSLKHSRSMKNGSPSSEARRIRTGEQGN
jgi:bifunctional non-homologous end joining protein LigD